MNEIKEKMAEFDNELLVNLAQYGFSKKKKHCFIRKIGICEQYVSIQDTKMRGEEKVHIFINVKFKYEEINKIIAYLKDEKYDKKWPTGSMNLNSLINAKDVYGFYIDLNTDIAPIINNLVSVLQKYGFPFLETCDTLEKYEEMLMRKNSKVVSSTISLDKPEWNLLALAILRENISVEEVIRDYEHDFVKIPMQWEMARKRIDKYDKIKEKI